MGAKKFSKYRIIQDSNSFEFDEYKKAKAKYYMLDAPKALFGITPIMNKKIKLLSKEKADDLRFAHSK